MTEQRWSAVIPIGRETRDRRLIKAMRLDRPWPLPLMQLDVERKVPIPGRLGSLPVGRVLYADIERKVLRLGGTMDGLTPEGLSWYAAVDLGSVTAIPFYALFGWREHWSMTGSLLAVTLVDRPTWNRQAPVVFW